MFRSIEINKIFNFELNFHKKFESFVLKREQTPKIMDLEDNPLNEEEFIDEDIENTEFND